MKIYGTIGPSCCETEVLTGLFQCGMTGIRLNVSHMSLIEAKEWIEHIHAAAANCRKEAELLIDLQGPELRVSAFDRQTEYLLEEGSKIILGKNERPDRIPIPQAVLDVLEPGQEILLDDGKLLLRAEENKVDNVYCKVLRGGKLLPRKSIALPGKQIDTPTLTEADVANIRIAKQHGVTGVMLPFVRGKKDIANVRKALADANAEEIQIFAKIENLSGVKAIEEIVAEADEVVIARGDLGNSMPLWELPAVQKKIADVCNARNRRFMVVTQMLASMEHTKVPTRAEVSDIFNAVLDGAASVMLTGETAAGDYPLEAMEYMVKTVAEARKYLKMRK